jgi:hypothetical protein
MRMSNDGTPISRGGRGKGLRGRAARQRKRQISAELEKLRRLRVGGRRGWRRIHEGNTRSADERLRS